MHKLFFVLMMNLVISLPAFGDAYKPALPVDHIEAIGTSVEKNVRNASVRVTMPYDTGHGSGSYVKYKDVHLVITAQHVASSDIGATYIVSHKSESHIATLIYSDEANDIGVLHVTAPFRNVKPMKFDPLDKPAKVGTDIVYSGYPSHHKLMSFSGRVAGYESNRTNAPGKHIILQTYGWFGCSGSVIYDLNGHQVGVLYGVDVEYYPTIQVQENMIWVVPMNELNIDKALVGYCIENQRKSPKACK